MMSAIFLKLINMSITASWAIAAVMILRLFLRRAPKWLRCVLWGIVAVRLVCPFSFESMFSLIPSTEIIRPAAVQYTAVPVIPTGTPVIDDSPGIVTGDPAVSTPGSNKNPWHTWIYAGSIVWITGLAILLEYAMISFLRIRQKTEEAVLLYDNVYICDAVRSPFILGVFRPCIYLPSDLENVQLKYVLAHERAHLKRKDHWWKPLGYCLLAVYWFNPLVWIAYTLLCQDIELACDEKAVRDLNMDGRKAYSRALVACSMKRRTVMVCPLAFGESGIKKRVKTVLNYRKPAFGLIAVAVAICAAVALCFLTNPRKDDSLAKMIDAEKEELTEQIGTMISEAEAARYSITDWELVVEQIEGERADCYFNANWISSREPEEDPLILGMYQAADSLSDETQKALALETADRWLAEMQSWHRAAHLKHPIVILRENLSLKLYYPHVIDGVETLIPLQEFINANWFEDTEKRFQDGVNIIAETVAAAPLNVPGNNVPESDIPVDRAPTPAMPENSVLTSNTPDNNVPTPAVPENSVPTPAVPENSVSTPNTPGNNVPTPAVPENNLSQKEIKEGINHYDLKGYDADSLYLDEIEWVTDPARAIELGMGPGARWPGYYGSYNETESVIRCFFAEECSFTLLDWHATYKNTDYIQVDQQTFVEIMAERESEYSTLSEVPFIIEIADGKIISVTEQVVQ